MALDETLKEYLVKIGWDVDELGFDAANKKINDFRSAIINGGSSMAASFTKAGLAIFDTIYTVVDSMWDLASATAVADLKVETFARRMWTTEQNARSLTTALDVLGMSYDELFFATPEQYNRFLQLNTLGKQLEAPAELDETLQKIRDIQFEISKTKLIFQYATRWVMYYLGEYLGTDIDTVKEKLKSFNDMAMKYLPVVTQKIAYVFNVFYRLGKTVVEVLAAIGRTAVGSFGDIETSGLRTIATLAAAFLALKSGPVGMFLLLLGAILLLLEDFMVWQKGGKSLFDWSVVSDKLQEMNDKLGDTPDKVNEIIEKVDELFGKIQAGQFIMAIVETFLDTVETGLDGINVALDLLNGLIDILLGNFEDLKDNPLLDDLKEFGSSFANIGGGWRQQTGQKVDNYIESKVPGISNFADMLNDWTWSALNALGIGSNRVIPKTENNTTNTQNNNVTNNFYGTTTDEQVDKIGGSIQRFRMWTPRT